MTKPDDTIFARTHWQHVQLWESLGGAWNASAVKKSQYGDVDALRVKRKTKDDAQAALLVLMKHVDAEARLAGKIAAARAAIHADDAK
jgi:hypothetical protein